MKSWYYPLVFAAAAGISAATTPPAPSTRPSDPADAFAAHVDDAFPELQSPCGSDFDRLCPGLRPGKGLGECLQKNRDKISTECQAKIRSVNESAERFRRQTARVVCDDDLSQFCKGVEPGGWRVYSCLKSHEGQLSDACRAELKS